MNFVAILPALLMAILGCFTLLGSLLRRWYRNQEWLVWFNLAGQVVVGAALFRQWLLVRGGGELLLGSNPGITVDGLALFANVCVWLSCLILFLTSYRYLEALHEHRGEYYALATFAQCGMYFMAAGNDLVTIFAGLELASICFYILVGFTRANRRSNEAALKYLLLGAISSAFVVYGFSLLYGVTGSTSLPVVVPVLFRPDSFGLVGTVVLLCGLLLKITAVPFHTWAPDAYDGAPTPVAGYLSVASKIAAFSVLLRFFESAGPTAQSIIAISGVLSLTVGSIAAITQDRVKRLFAYSGIAHAGYLLLGLSAGSRTGIFVYLFVYAVMNGGAFALLASLRHHGVSGEYVSDLRGLSRSHPVHAALFVVLLLSLAGIPPTAGFIGKYYIFAALIQTHHLVLAAVAASYIVVSLYFYFRLVKEMYLVPVNQPAPTSASLGIRLTLAATAIATLLIGVFPEPVLHTAALLSETAR